jgi:undecaprenyl-diphosphatase
MGAAAAVPALHMAAAGIAGVLVYKSLKHRLVRERPYITHAAIACGTRPLDRYSFPSGHTLHAVCFTVLANHYYPAFGPLLYPFTISVMLSRPVLGLHYPTDVIAGGVIGWVLAVGSLLLVAP